VVAGATLDGPHDLFGNAAHMSRVPPGGTVTEHGCAPAVLDQFGELADGQGRLRIAIQ
jgi:hypothetical protein